MNNCKTITAALRMVPRGSVGVSVPNFHAGLKENVIPDLAELDVSIRAFDPQVRERALAAVHRMVMAEAQAGGAPREPEIVPVASFPVSVNDEDATRRVIRALQTVYGRHGATLADAPLAAGDDFAHFAHFATAAGCPSAYWTWGGTAPRECGCAHGQSLSALCPARRTSHRIRGTRHRRSRKRGLCINGGSRGRPFTCRRALTPPPGGLVLAGGGIVAGAAGATSVAAVEAAGLGAVGVLLAVRGGG
jgi:hypothetical protein